MSRSKANQIPVRAMLLFHRSSLWWFLVLLIFAVGLGVRLYDLSDPPLDFHPTRQLHSAIIARGMYYESQADIPEGQRQMAVALWQTEGLIEPQVFERLTAWTYGLFGETDLRIPRLYAIAFWMIAAVFLVWVALELTGWAGALVAALFFLIWPYNVIASRAFQPEPLMIAFCAAALWAALGWERHQSWPWALAAGLLGGLAIYIKSVAVFFIGPVLLVLVLAGGLRRALRSPQVWLMGLLAVLPYAIYHIDGVYLRGYLVEQFSQRFFPEMWVDPAFYLRWLSNLGRVVPFEMLVVAILGMLLVRRPLHRALLLGMWVGYFLYGMTLPHHISTHDYYHLLLLPQVTLGLAGAGEILLQNLRGPFRLMRAFAAAVVLVVLLIEGYSARNILKRYDAAAQARAYQQIGQQLGPGASAVALVPDYGSGLKYWAWINPALWQTGADVRYRASLGESFEFAAFFADQAASRDFFVITFHEELDRQPQLKEWLSTNYPVYQQSPDYLIYDLRPNPQ